MLEPVQRALAGQRSTVLPLSLELAGERRQHRVMAQLIVIDQVLVAKGNAEHPLRHHGLNRVLDLRDKTGGEPPHETDPPIGRAEQQPAGIRGVVPAVKRGHHLTALNYFITEQVATTR